MSGGLTFSVSRRRIWILVGLILGAAAILWLLFTAGLTILRYRLNYSSAYDFGIFSQMYYYMDQCLQPLTTCERDGLLSHFAVHLSPTFYLLLPFYKLVPRPETLLLFQALLVVSGVIPLCLLGRNMNLGPGPVLVFGLMYICYPAFMGGCFYDFHENKFLSVLILWTMYWLESGRYKTMGFFALLILLVKEDAPVYAACIGLYLFLEKRQHLWGGAVFLFSCLYFTAAVWFLDRFGDGAMINRFDSYISDESYGLLSMFKTILVDPAYVLAQILTPDKILFLLQMLLPLGFLPLMSLRLGKWVLLIPFVLINLMSNYKYQHSIFFQYTYGSGALLFYLAMVNFRDLKLPIFRQLRPLFLGSGLFCAVALVLTVGSTKTRYLDLWEKNAPKAQEARELLSEITYPKAAIRWITWFWTCVPDTSGTFPCSWIITAKPAGSWQEAFRGTWPFSRPRLGKPSPRRLHPLLKLLIKPVRRVGLQIKFPEHIKAGCFRLLLAVQPALELFVKIVPQQHKGLILL